MKCCHTKIHLNSVTFWNSEVKQKYTLQKLQLTSLIFKFVIIFIAKHSFLNSAAWNSINPMCDSLFLACHLEFFDLKSKESRWTLLSICYILQWSSSSCSVDFIRGQFSDNSWFSFYEYKETKKVKWAEERRAAESSCTLHTQQIHITSSWIPACCEELPEVYKETIFRL